MVSEIKDRVQPVIVKEILCNVISNPEYIISNFEKISKSEYRIVFSSL